MDSNNEDKPKNRAQRRAARRAQQHQGSASLANDRNIRLEVSAIKQGHSVLRELAIEGVRDQGRGFIMMKIEKGELKRQGVQRMTPQYITAATPNVPPFLVRDNELIAAYDPAREMLIVFVPSTVDAGLHWYTVPLDSVAAADPSWAPRIM